MTEIAIKVTDIICEQLRVRRAVVRGCASFVDDLGADSLTMVELVLAMEQAFGISVSDRDAERIHTVAEAISCIERRHQACHNSRAAS
jgi:acyl carrier protein